MYGLNMSKINDLLAKLEAAQVTSQDFVKAKVDIQVALLALIEETSYQPLKTRLEAMHTTWRRLGADGNLRRYNDAIRELKVVMSMVERIQPSTE